MKFLAKPTASSGCHTSQGIQSVQPFPEFGLLADNSHPPLALPPFDLGLMKGKGRAVASLIRHKEVYERFHYTCVFCGFDGRTFDKWMQLSIDHVRPRSAGGDDCPDNLVVCCRSCNSITSRMKFSENDTREEIIQQKRDRVRKSRGDF